MFKNYLQQRQFGVNVTKLTLQFLATFQCVVNNWNQFT